MDPQQIALAFAVASLQNHGAAEGFPQIPQALLDAAASSQAGAAASSHGSMNANQPTNEQQAYVPTVSKEHSEGSVASNDNTATAEEANNDDGDDDEDDNERRLARSRERNREHARKTRLRKKAQLEALQSKVKGLEAERQVLKQKVEECGIASILIGLSSGGGAPQDQATLSLLDSASTVSPTAKKSTEQRSDMVAVLSGAKRKRFISEAIGEQPNQQQHRLTINIDGNVTVIGAGKSHINWKSGIYRDQDGVQRQLTPDQLEDLRRERNRMHAKMTRSRKKCFVATIEKAIEELEAENTRMRGVLEKVSASSTLTQMVTPASSPALAPTPGPAFYEGSEDSDYSQPAGEQQHEEQQQQQQQQQQPPRKLFKAEHHQENPAPAPRASHGFRLDG